MRGLSRTASRCPRLARRLIPSGGVHHPVAIIAASALGRQHPGRTLEDGQAPVHPFRMVIKTKDLNRFSPEMISKLDFSGLRHERVFPFGEHVVISLNPNDYTIHEALDISRSIARQGFVEDLEFDGFGQLLDTACPPNDPCTRKTSAETVYAARSPTRTSSR